MIQQGIPKHLHVQYVQMQAVLHALLLDSSPKESGFRPQTTWVHCPALPAPGTMLLAALLELSRSLSEAAVG